MTEQSTEPNIILTRYLYSLSEVKHSLFLSILDKKSDEALFWLYEIYYSGFPDAALEFITNIFNDVFAYDNPDLIKPFNRIITNFEENPSDNDDISFGTMVHNMCLRKYRIEHFMKTYLGIICEPSPNVTKKNLYITLKRDNIQKYETKPSIEKTYMYLRGACEYHIRKEGNKVFGEDIDTKEQYLNNWLYYAYGSPIWKDRVSEYGGKPDDEMLRIVFPDEEAESEFYDKWNMETDEQPMEVSNKITGDGSVCYMSATEFCIKYGGVMKTKKVLKIIKPLENTISQGE